MNTKKNTLLKLLIAIQFLAVCVQAKTQNDLNTPFNKNIVYAEATTKGATYSVNYERIFRFGKKLNWSYRAGFFINGDAIAWPLGINAFTGSNAHHLEFSFIATPYIYHYHSFLKKEDLSDKYLYAASTIGYRYQKLQGKLYAKIAAGPLLFLDPPSDDFWKMDPQWYAFGTIAFGLCF